MYLSKKIFELPYGTEATGVDFDKFERAHLIWRHAKNKLNGEPSEFDLVDCVTSLKRAVNSRIKTLSKEYSFNDLPNIRSKKQTLEKYQDYGLIRPSILKELFELRNLLEHEDTPPPSKKESAYYVDIVWYFLKSTDSLLQMKVDAVMYMLEPSSNKEISLHIKPHKNWEVHINGDISDELILDRKANDCIEFDVFEPKTVSYEGKHRVFSGSLKLASEDLILIAREYFGAQGYWFEDHLI